MVEVEGRPNLLPACATELLDGMVLHTESEAVVEARRLILDLLLSDHPMACITCEQSGGCTLQDYCYRYGIEHSSFEGERHELPIESDNPMIERDMNKCILCGKCVRVCEEVQVTDAIDFTERGFDSQVAALRQAARHRLLPLLRPVRRHLPHRRDRQQADQGRAHLGPQEVRTTCPFCGVGCNFDLNVAGDKVIGVTAAYDAPANQGSLCVKGRFHIDLIYSPDRITTPLIKKNGEWETSTWDEALDLWPAAARDPRRGQPRRRRAQLGALHQRGELPAAAPHAGGHRHEHHRPLRPYLTRSHGRRSGDQLGSGAMTNSIGEIVGNDVLFIIGSNATEAHPIIGNKMKQAVRQGASSSSSTRGASSSPSTPTSAAAQAGHRHRLLNGMMHTIIGNGWQDEAYIERGTEGFDALKDTVKNYPPERASEICGVPAETSSRRRELYATTPKAGIYYTLGITEHTAAPTT